MDYISDIAESTRDSDFFLIRLIYYSAYGIGLLVTLHFTIALLIFVHRHLFMKKKDLIARYGQSKGGSWALVTGAGDGIGAEFCR